MILADCNVLLDVIEADPQRYAWSSRGLDDALASGLVVSFIICAEIARIPKRRRSRGVHFALGDQGD